ncbi:MAG: hypothetical protein AB8H80_09845 [Planctomycetota bacterium]
MQMNLRRCFEPLALAAACAISAMGQAPAVRQEASSPQATDVLGAANWVPSTSAGFWSAMRLAEQVEAIATSRAWRQVASTPLWLAAEAAWSRSPFAQNLEQVRDDLVLVDDGVELLLQMASEEVFLCLDGRWRNFIAQLSSLYADAFLLGAQEGLRGPGPSRGDRDREAQQLAVKRMMQLSLPGALFGGRVAEPEQAGKWLAEFVGSVRDVLPASVVERSIAGGRFYVLQLRFDSFVDPQLLRSLRATSKEQGGDLAKRLEAFGAKPFAVALGIRGDYLLASVGPDTRQLEQLGVEKCLAQSSAFASVREVCRPGVASLSYICSELSERQPIDPDSAEFLVDSVETASMQNGEPLPEGFTKRLRDDLRALWQDLGAAYGPARAETSIAFLDHGIESYSFRAALVGHLDSSAPLDVIASAGDAPLLFYASRSKSLLSDYRRLAKWCRTAYSYFEDYKVPMLAGGDRDEYEQFEQLFLPLIRDLHDATSNRLLPAVGSSGLVALHAPSGDAQAAMIAGQSWQIPSPSVVHELRDKKQFRSACAEVRRTFEQAVRAQGVDVAALYDGSALASLGMRSTVATSDSRLVWSLSERVLLNQLVARYQAPSGKVDLRKSAGAAMYVDVARVSELLATNLNSAMAMLGASGGLDRRTEQFVRLSLPRIATALAAMRTYTSRTWISDGIEITHAWLQVKDL